MNSSRKPISLAGLATGLAGVGAVTLTLSALAAANASTAGFFFLLVVLGVAATGGFLVAAVVSLVATLCFNFFFLPPVGTFMIADPENWVALFTFLLTALVASHLSNRAQMQCLGVTVTGRHTALGDAMVTAEVFQKLVPLLAAMGDRKSVV